MDRRRESDDSEVSREEEDPELDSLLRKAARVSDELLPLPRAGQVIGNKYRIESRIGRGGMGAVFRAIHVVSQKRVALKWMLASSSDERARQRFLREARVTARLNHPNVVNVYDVGQEDGAWYLVMELLDGEPLRTKLKEGPLCIDEALQLLVPAMRGVAAVHRAGIVHRDLKPDNIFLCHGVDGAPGEAKVLDFGVSAMTSDALDVSTLTEDGALLGTPAYMSPEQLQSARDIDARADVYSFGVILYEALTGRVPFTSVRYAALVLAVSHEVPRPPAELRPEISEALSRIVMRTLAKSPDDRFPSIDSLITAITALSPDAPGAAAARRRRLAAQATAFATGAIAAGALAFWLLPRSGFDSMVDSAGAAEPETRSSPAMQLLPPDWFEAQETSREHLFPRTESSEMCPVRLATPAVRATPPAQAIASQATPAPVPAPPAPTMTRRARPARVQAAPPRPDKPPDPGWCDPPFSLDAAGRKLFKVECL